MTGGQPWPEVPVGNKDHANAAVVIVGAGISGMCTAIDLVKRNNCRNFIILEKSAGVGGTWLDNKYPGCCCDVWSTLYSYSFAQKADWTREYPGQEEILSYLTTVAQEYNLYQHVRFNTTVESSTWDDQAKKWQTKVTTAPGSKEAEFTPDYTISSDFLVSAVGQLNQPQWPKIEGLDMFQGKRMHSARWDWSYDLQDKKIALVGNGCTAVQILPEIAKVARHVTVFQRTPNWIVPRMDAPVSPFMRSVYKYVPPVRWLNRSMKMDFRESTHAAVSDNSSAMAQLFEQATKDMLESQIVNKPHLREQLLPKYKVGCKRIIISDDFFPTLDSPNVDLETRPIKSITSNNVVVGDNSVEASAEGYDLLVCATGFKTVDFMHPIKLTGVNGRSLSDVWSNGAEALYGVCVEDMPNFGMLYGPNSNLGHNSIILMVEAQSRFINGLIQPVLEARRHGKALGIKPRKDRLVAFNNEIQAELNESSFADPNCQSWYRDPKNGKIVNNWSRTVVQYQKMVETVNLAEDFVTDGSGIDVAARKGVVNVGRVKEERYAVDLAVTVVASLGTVAVVGAWLLRNNDMVRRLIKS